MIKHEFTQGSESWKMFRNERIGASDIPVIMNTSPHMKIMELWLQKIGEAPPIKENFAMSRGNHFEPIVREKWKAMSGDDYQPLVVTHSEHNWAMASLDGFHVLETNPKDSAIIEIKYNGRENHEFTRTGAVPLHHYQQVQWQLFITGSPLAFYLSYNGDELLTVEVKPDMDMIPKLFEKAQWFYNCLITRTPPEDPVSDDLIALMDEYAELAKQAQIIEESMELIKGQIRDITPLEKTIAWKNVVGAWRFRQGNVDYSKIEALKSLNLDQYRKKGTSYFELKVKL